MQAMAQAQKASAGTTNAALTATNAAIAKLDPVTRGFAQYLIGTWKPVWEQVQASAARGLLPGVQEALQALLPIMPQVERLVQTIGQGLAGLFQQMVPLIKQFVTLVQQAAGPTFQALGTIITAVFGDLIKIAQAFIPLIVPVAQFIKILADAFTALIIPLEPIALQLFTALNAALTPLVPVMGVIAGAVASVVAAFIPLLGPISQLIQILLPPLARLIGMVAPIFAQVAGVVLQLAIQLAQALIPPLMQVAQTLLPAFKQILDALSPVIPVIAAAVIQIVNAFVPLIPLLVQAALSLLPPFLQIMQILTPIIPIVAQAIVMIVDAIAPLIPLLVQLVTPLLPPLVDLFKNLAPIIGAVVPIIAQLIAAIAPFIGQLIQALIPAVQLVGTVMSDVFNGIGTVITWVVNNVLLPGINFFIDIIDGLLDKINTVAGWFGANQHWHVDHVYPAAAPAQVVAGSAGHVGMMATGGLVSGPGTGTSDSIPVRLSNGEFVVNAQSTAAHLPLLAAINGGMGSGGPGFAGGGLAGVVSSIGSGISSAAGFVEDTAKVLSDPIGYLTDAIKGALGGAGADSMSQILASGVTSLIKDAGSWISSMFGGGGSSGGSGGGAVAASPGGGVERLRPIVDNVLRMLGQPISMDNGVLSLIQHESGGQSGIVNKWDSNWTAGHPSVGDMQLIAGTFAQYAGPFRNTGPFSYGVSTDDTANIYAGVSYALKNYGPAMLMAGGRHNASGHYIGYDSGGLLPPGPSLVYNGTGHNEIVAPAQNFQQAMAGLNPSTGTGGPTVVNIYDADNVLIGTMRGEINRAGQSQQLTAAAGSSSVIR
jgi:SLT domain-containing protein